jgi:hypothetical protein
VVAWEFGVESWWSSEASGSPSQSASEAVPKWKEEQVTAHKALFLHSERPDLQVFQEHICNCAVLFCPIVEAEAERRAQKQQSTHHNLPTTDSESSEFLSPERETTARVPVWSLSAFFPSLIFCSQKAQSWEYETD